MSELFYSSAEHGTLLLAVPGRRGVLGFPWDGGEFPGLSLKLKPRVSVAEQFRAYFSELGFGGGVNVNFHLQSDLVMSIGVSRALYLGDAQIEISDRVQLLSFPDILRRLEGSKFRLAYLRAWQFYMGAYTEELRAELL